MVDSKVDLKNNVFNIVVLYFLIYEVDRYQNEEFTKSSPEMHRPKLIKLLNSRWI